MQTFSTLNEEQFSPSATPTMEKDLSVAAAGSALELQTLSEAIREETQRAVARFVGNESKGYYVPVDEDDLALDEPEQRNSALLRTDSKDLLSVNLQTVKTMDRSLHQAVANSTVKVSDAIIPTVPTTTIQVTKEVPEQPTLPQQQVSRLTCEEEGKDNIGFTESTSSLEGVIGYVKVSCCLSFSNFNLPFL